MIFRGDMGFSKHLQADKPAMFCFPIADNPLLNSATIGASPNEKKGRQEQAAHK
jgi:hypothetical protein